MDNELIQQAEAIPYTRWWEINYLMDIATDEATRERLKWIQCRKRLLEQYSV